MPNTRLKDLFRRAEAWRTEAQDRLVEAGLAIEAMERGTYRPTPDELAAIDEGLAQLDRGETATEKEVEDAFSRFRGG